MRLLRGSRPNFGFKFRSSESEPASEPGPLSRVDIVAPRPQLRVRIHLQVAACNLNSKGSHLSSVPLAKVVDIFMSPCYTGNFELVSRNARLGRSRSLLVLIGLGYAKPSEMTVASPAAGHWQWSCSLRVAAARRAASARAQRDFVLAKAGDPLLLYITLRHFPAIYLP